ncbi:hypothetical protein NMY22_g3429 [Coprinellus aureogranulatus]|nr:hypothetical protein NMY22_g3429 [Coprinellus aureogranulatus]
MAVVVLIGAIVLLVLYVRLNDARLRKLPIRIASLSKRLTPQAVRADAAEFFRKPQKNIKSQLPGRTGRKYIVVGGGGFLGGWIVQQLLERGENPENIRVLDIATTPANYVVSDAMKDGLQYIQTDISSRESVQRAFDHVWKDNDSAKETTVFHTAANIRFYELHPSFLSRSAKVNVDGVRNVLEAAKAAGVDVFIFTSSGSVAVKSTRFLLWPWESEPKHFVQVINDETPLPQSHWEHFSNYAVTKREGERFVMEADGALLGTGLKMRTGCIRPGNGVFGPRGDMLCGAYLLRKSNPSWIQNTMHSFSYVENCALAHLLYERRLLDLQEREGKGERKLPDIGGQSFVIADPGPTPTYGDAYTILETLTDGECHFQELSPTAMFLLCKFISFYYVNQQRLSVFLSVSSHPFVTSIIRPILSRVLPPLQGDIINLQPPLFYLTSVHLIFDDSRARLSPEKGGLGFEGVWTTYEGLYKTWHEHQSGLSGKTNARSAKAGVSFNFWGKKSTTKVVAATAMGTVKDGIAMPVVSVEEDS